MPPSLDSARERLSRADENIQSLKREIDSFWAPAPTVILNVERNEPVITDKDRKAFEELKEFIKTPIRVQTNSPHQIEFPVFDRTPEVRQTAKKTFPLLSKSRGNYQSHRSGTN